MGLLPGTGSKLPSAPGTTPTPGITPAIDIPTVAKPTGTASLFEGLTDLVKGTKTPAGPKSSPAYMNAVEKFITHDGPNIKMDGNLHTTHSPALIVLSKQQGDLINAVQEMIAHLIEEHTNVKTQTTDSEELLSHVTRLIDQKPIGTTLTGINRNATLVSLEQFIGLTILYALAEATTLEPTVSPFFSYNHPVISFSPRYRDLVAKVRIPASLKEEARTLIEDKYAAFLDIGLARRELGTLVRQFLYAGF